MTKMACEENSVAEFLRLADQFDVLAAAARTEAVKQALERLATRFRVFAAQHAHTGGVRRPLIYLESRDSMEVRE